MDLLDKNGPNGLYALSKKNKIVHWVYPVHLVHKMPFYKDKKKAAYAAFRIQQTVTSVFPGEDAPRGDGLR